MEGQGCRVVGNDGVLVEVGLQGGSGEVESLNVCVECVVILNGKNMYYGVFNISCRNKCVARSIFGTNVGI